MRTEGLGIGATSGTTTSPDGGTRINGTIASRASNPTASDALLILRVAVKQPVTPYCPA